MRLSRLSPVPALPVRSLRPALIAGGMLALLAGWSPAQAAPAVDDAGAKALAASLKKDLPRWFPPPSEDGEGVGFEWQGEPTVKPAGDHYDVALPRLSAEDAEGTLFDIGTVLLSVTPKDDGQYGVSITLPSAIKVQNLDDNDEYVDAATISIGKQSFTSTWSGALETLLAVDAAYNDIAVNAADGKGKISVASMTMVQDLKPEAGTGGATLWSGPAAFAFGGLSVKDDKNKELVKIGGVTAEATYTRVDLTKVSALQKLSEQTAAKGAAPTSAELLPKLQGIFGGVSGAMRLSNLSVVNPEDGTTVTLGQLAFRSGLTDLDQAMSTVSMGIEARDFAMTPSPAPAAFTPRAFEMKLSVAKLPNSALWKAFTELAKAAEAEEAPPPKKGAKAKAAPPPPSSDVVMQQAMAAMGEAGTELRIDALNLDTPATAGTATGAVKVATQAAFGVTGGANVLLRGIDAAVKAMQPAPGAKPDKETQDLLGGLAMVQAMGQAGKDDTGADIRTYKFEVTEAGQLLLNGADMTPLLAGGGEPAPAPAEKPKKK
ncbi:hypothetical protein HUE56_21890 [Azospirillum oryzae]|uniref:DUF945 domain-containing protein n=1 Tax=Azospirillum oryzae TaxID=286727 RepID=A0A6N1AUP2_9PROT|nr:DUF945 domain-containing protein [Azospirillum oryzae]KAA0590629.1 DUF945 domain-containing protein [Azospirillum oryzae]QKS52994.1 hypothetical protein HUE56_21890 [Azospirillum oryzae]GLR81711.1 hypothetical protein GCM10007856_44000 [Azospirillum oryzae]